MEEVGNIACMMQNFFMGFVSQLWTWKCKDDSEKKKKCILIKNTLGEINSNYYIQYILFKLKAILICVIYC